MSKKIQFFVKKCLARDPKNLPVVQMWIYLKKTLLDVYHIENYYLL